MTWAGLDSLDGHPSLIELPPLNANKKEKNAFVTNVFGKFVEEYVMTEFDMEKSWRMKQVPERLEPIVDTAAPVCPPLQVPPVFTAGTASCTRK